MPKKITFTGVNNPTTTYVYSAGGDKLSVTHSSSISKRTDYVGNKIYENGSLKRILVEGGYYEPAVNGYCFYLQDHQGNNRVVADQPGSVVQSNHYYPYGMPFAESTYTDKQPYKYNAKELDAEYGLNLYDYGARQMESLFGRFTTPDPLSEKYYSMSPYAYCANNPVKYVDSDGRKISIFYNNNGQLRSFIFNGSNQSSAPTNSFVRAVIYAYDYNVKNGGGTNLKKIVENSKYNVGVQESDTGSESIGTRNLVLFNPRGGLRLDDGNVLSPATILEHEFAHVVDRKEGTVDITKNSKYITESERRVIQGAELTTAKANGELPQIHKGRKSHSEGSRIVTMSSTSTKESSKEESKVYNERVQKEQERRSRQWTSE